MKLSDLGHPKEREDFIRELCRVFDAQALTVVEREFNFMPDQNKLDIYKKP